MNAPDDASTTMTGANPGAIDAPGALLRDARERAGLSQEDIAGKLKLAPRQIAAIEIGDWNSLPERTFTRGFMRSYARLVGLDPNVVGLDRSPSQPNVGSELKPTPEAIGEVTLESSRRSASTARWVVPALLVAVLAAGVAYFQLGGMIGLGALKYSATTPLSSGVKTGATPVGATAANPPLSGVVTEPSVTPLVTSGSLMAPAASSDAKGSAAVLAPTPAEPADARQAPAAASEPVITLAPTPSLLLPATSGERRITITFKGKSWTEVRSKGDVIYSEASLPGVKELNGKPPLSFIVGNASNVVLSIDGKPYDMSSLTRNDVARFRID